MLLMSELDHTELVPCWANYCNEREVWGACVVLGRHFRHQVSIKCVELSGGGAGQLADEHVFLEMVTKREMRPV